ncbi:hypothetical protein D3C81_1662120 [compost metagenome]
MLDVLPVEPLELLPPELFPPELFPPLLVALAVRNTLTGVVLMPPFSLVTFAYQL